MKHDRLERPTKRSLEGPPPRPPVPFSDIECLHAREFQFVLAMTDFALRSSETARNRPQQIATSPVVSANGKI